MRLEHFDLNLLRSLDALVTEQNVTRAAEKLHVTQQAMSGSLKRLREHFEDEILVRIGSRLELTPKGIALAGPVREVLLQIGRTLETIPRFDPATAKHRFRVAMSDYAAIVVMPPILRRLLEEAPGIHCNILPLEESAFAGLDSGHIDLIVLPRKTLPASDVIRSMHLFNDVFVCVFDPAQHRLSEMTLERYVTLPHAGVRFVEGHPGIIDQAWIRHDITPRLVATSTGFAGVMYLIPGTPMIATVQRRLAERLAEGLSLSWLPCPIQIPRLEQEVCWHARRDDDPVHGYLRELFVGTTAEMDGVAASVAS